MLELALRERAEACDQRIDPRRQTLCAEVWSRCSELKAALSKGVHAGILVDEAIDHHIVLGLQPTHNVVQKRSVT